MIKMILAVPLVALLTACGDPSVEDLMDDPKLLNEVAENCAEMKRSEAREDTGCQNVQEAAERLVKEQFKSSQDALKSMLK